MSADLVSRTRALLEGTTDGPWEVVWESPEWESGGDQSPYAYAIHGPADRSTLDCTWLSDDYKAQYGHQITEIVGLSDTDAEFIAGARQLVPELVAEVEKLLPYAGPGPYEPTGIGGWKAPTWQELRDLADHNFRLYAHAQAEVDRARDDLRASTAEVEKLSGALSALVDPDDCHLDHHGGCQAHGFFDEPCGHATAKELLAQQAAR